MGTAAASWGWLNLDARHSPDPAAPWLSPRRTESAFSTSMSPDSPLRRTIFSSMWMPGYFLQLLAYEPFEEIVGQIDFLDRSPLEER